jgi:hypothetical protein
MPPRGMKRPSKEEIADFTNWLEGSLDKMGAANPDPGRATLRRMNRAEYANAVRDLLALEIDVSQGPAGRRFRLWLRQYRRHADRLARR